MVTDTNILEEFTLSVIMVFFYLEDRGCRFSHNHWYQSTCLNAPPWKPLIFLLNDVAGFGCNRTDKCQVVDTRNDLRDLCIEGHAVGTAWALRWCKQGVLSSCSDAWHISQGLGTVGWLPWAAVYTRCTTDFSWYPSHHMLPACLSPPEWIQVQKVPGQGNVGYWGVCLWPWWWLCMETSGLWPIDDVLPYTLGWSAVMSCEDKLILFCKLEFSAVFYLVRVVHKLALILLQTEYLTNCD